MLAWLKDNGPTIGAVSGAVVALGVVMQLVVVGPMNRAFDGQDDRFDDLRAEMNHRFDDLRAAMQGQFEAVDQRFDDLRAEMNGRFEAVDQRFDAVDRRFDAVDRRIDRLTDEVSELRKLTVGIGERVSLNEGQIRVIVDRLRAADTPDSPIP